jgi:hypothetical protein
MSDSTRFALTAMYVAMTEAISLATGKPVVELTDCLMRSIAKNAPSESSELCLFLANSSEITRDSK